MAEAGTNTRADGIKNEYYAKQIAGITAVVKFVQDFEAIFQALPDEARTQIQPVYSNLLDVAQGATEILAKGIGINAKG